jgi:hypothetical protein
MPSSVFSTSEAIPSTPLLIALVTLKGYQEFENGEKLYIEDLAEYLVRLKAGGINISRIALSRSLDKYWSEDVAQFVSEGLVFGFLTHKSPLRFDKRCVTVCNKAIQSHLRRSDALKTVIEDAKRILDLRPIESTT